MYAQGAGQEMKVHVYKSRKQSSKPLTHRHANVAMQLVEESIRHPVCSATRNIEVRAEYVGSSPNHTRSALKSRQSPQSKPILSGVCDRRKEKKPYDPRAEKWFVKYEGHRLPHAHHGFLFHRRNTTSNHPDAHHRMCHPLDSTSLLQDQTLPVLLASAGSVTLRQQS